MNYQKVTSYLKTVVILVTLAFSFTKCTDEEILNESQAPNTQDADTSTFIASVADCSTCTYVVPPNTTVVDGAKLNLKPGSIIGLSASVKYKQLQFRNINGTAEKPIIIKNCDGTALITATGLPYAWKFWNSKFFKITGGSVANTYGIKINGGHLSLTLEYLSTNFEIDHIEIFNSGFSGVMAKTDPSCDILTTRGYFTMRNIFIHDNYVHDVGGEGFYVGNSKFAEGQSTSCGIRFPHNIENVKIYNNKVKNSGWEGLQLGCGGKDAAVYNNSIENFGIANKSGQNNGIQIGSGTGGICYNNLVKSGKGNGIIVMGTGDNIIHNNIIINAGSNGVFCDERASTGRGFQFINNTIISPLNDGIRIYADLLPNNIIMNNIIVNPGSYSKYSGSRTGNDAYVYKLSNAVDVVIANNYFTRSLTAPKFVNAAGFNYRLTSTSPLINKGKSISAYSIPKDFYQGARLKGTGYDIGASEY